MDDEHARLLLPGNGRLADEDGGKGAEPEADPEPVTREWIVARLAIEARRCKRDMARITALGLLAKIFGLMIDRIRIEDERKAADEYAARLGVDREEFWREVQSVKESVH
jgi:hypothetical protein